MATAERRSSSGVLGGIQALRAIAASAVVLAHIGAPDGVEHKFAGHDAVLGPIYNVGITGVDLFFVISGFVMYMTVRGADRGPKQAGRFLWRRATRIYPPYLIVTGLVFAVYLVQPHLVNSAEHVRPNVLASFLILPQRGLPLLPVGWTLVYELFFYLVFAAILILPKRFFVPALVAWGVITLVLMPIHTHDLVLHIVHSAMVFEFLAGVAIGALAPHLPRWAGLAAAATGTVAGLTLYTIEWNHRGTFVEHPGLREATIGGALALVVLGIAALEAHSLLRTPRILVRLGAASYSIYLTHLLTFGALSFVIARIPIHNALVHVAVVLGAFVLALAVGLAFFQLVERPLLRLLTRRRRPKAAPAELHSVPVATAAVRVPVAAR